MRHHSRRLNLTGKQFGNLTCIIEMPRVLFSKKYHPIWLCRCGCGKDTQVKQTYLIKGHKADCGCVAENKAAMTAFKRNQKNLQKLFKRQYRHANWRKRWADYEANPGSKKRHPLINQYKTMIRRCHKPGYVQYKYYGAVGRSVCQEWRDDFWAYVKYVGKPPSPDHSLERLDNDGNYEPGNVEWVTHEVQMNNRSNSVRVDFAGCELTIKQAANFFDVHPRKLAYRTQTHGYNAEQILSALAC